MTKKERLVFETVVLAIGSLRDTGDKYKDEGEQVKAKALLDRAKALEDMLIEWSREA